jgi:hypothetical protein
MLIQSSYYEDHDEMVHIYLWTEVDYHAAHLNILKPTENVRILRVAAL